MAKLTREIQKIFATDAQSTQVTAFRTAGDVPTYTKDVSLIQNSNFTTGWLDADNAGNVIPYAEDMNGLFYTLSRNIAYINQAGIPEWSSSETYYQNAMCMYSGVLYKSLQDNNASRQPDTQTSYWTPYASPVSGSVTGGANLGTGEGIYASTVTGTMNFKSLVAGTNITLTPSVDGTSVTIDASNGGAITSVSWGDIQGSIANQTDLATALGQRGTLSGTNTWTGTNTFSAITLGSNDLATTLSNKQNVINAGNPLSASYVSGLASVATSGSYNDLSNQPSIPTVYDATLTIQKNGTSVGTFTANASSDVTLNITETIQSASSPLSISSNALSISQANTSTNGYLSSTDWNTFNGKQDAINSSNKLSTKYLNVNSNIIPIYNNAYTLGASNIAFSCIYTNELGPALGAGETRILVNSDFSPYSDSTYSLGNSDKCWTNVYSASFSFNSSVYFSISKNNRTIRFVSKNSSAVSRSITFNPDYAGFFPEQNSVISLGHPDYRWSTVYYTTLNPSSDIRLKDNIEDLENGLAKINSLDVKSFTFKNKPDHIEYGIIAQDTVSENPELISVPEEESGYYGIYLHNFVFLAVKAIQELSAKVQVLENKLKEI